MYSVRHVTNAETSVIADLTELLIEAVHGGASVGFLAPLSRETAAHYWKHVFSNPGAESCLLVAECEGKVIGSVQLALCARENGRHRGEIQKLFVHHSQRGRGVGSGLMAEAESLARGMGRTLLVLDTQVGSSAEWLYRRRGWRRVGEVPGYAANPDGLLRATAYYFKQL